MTGGMSREFLAVFQGPARELTCQLRREKSFCSSKNLGKD